MVAQDKGQHVQDKGMPLRQEAQEAQGPGGGTGPRGAASFLEFSVNFCCARAKHPCCLLEAFADLQMKASHSTTVSLFYGGGC